MMTETTNAIMNDVVAPIWSVMIPTFNPSEYLEKVLNDVLSQKEKHPQMEVVVVDDASDKVDTAKLVLNYAGDRVACVVHKTNKGLAGNWNYCISNAQGKYVHILHQDDRIHPGFYSNIEKLFQDYPQCGAAFCRHEFIDENNNVIGTSELEQNLEGVIAYFIDRIFVSQRIQCPSIVVPKAIYQLVGLFRDDLHYTLDWDMWKRIAAEYEIAYSPEILCAYRIHSGSETTRLRQRGICFKDHLKAVNIAKEYLPKSKANALATLAKRHSYQIELGFAWSNLLQGNARTARSQAFNLIRLGCINMEVMKLIACSFRGI
jgi:glycosyltransferase involved in cell wall biosynthesis